MGHIDWTTMSLPVLFAVLIFGAGFIYGRKNEGASSSEENNNDKNSASEPVECRSCGSSLSKDDAFCRKCGEKNSAASSCEFRDRGEKLHRNVYF